MLIDNFEAKVNALFAGLARRWDRWLPFGGKYLEALRLCILANASAAKALVERAYADGDVHAAIDFLIAMARANMRLAFPLNLFSGMALEIIAQFMHQNADLFRTRIGDPAPHARG